MTTTQKQPDTSSEAKAIAQGRQGSAEVTEPSCLRCSTCLAQERLQPHSALPTVMPALGLELNKSKKPTHTRSYSAARQWVSGALSSSACLVFKRCNSFHLSFPHTSSVTPPPCFFLLPAQVYIVESSTTKLPAASST